MKNLVLIGLSGCGKSTIGKRLARKLRMPLLDTDTMIKKTRDAPFPIFSPGTVKKGSEPWNQPVPGKPPHMTAPSYPREEA